MKNDINLSNYNIKETSFRFVQNNERLSDTKLKTKTTTFAKDSFRRFCKNKSSVVGAIVLGILILLSIFVPIFSPHDVNTVSASEAFLEPKLFKAGTGFWDGTKTYEKKTNLDGSPSGVMYDFENDVPAGFYKPAVLNCVVDEEPTYINIASKYGKGGYVMFENQKEQDASKNLINTTLISSSFTIRSSGNYTLKVAFGNVDDINEGKLGEYRLYLSGGGREVVLRDWSTDYSDIELNIRDLVPGSMSGAKICFELKPDQTKKTYVLIKSCELSTDVEAQRETIEKVGFADATKMVLLAKDEKGVFPAGYWSCTGRKGIYAAEVYYCSFVYDTYEVAYGLREQSVAASDLKKWKDNGWCDYDETDVKDTFKKLTDDCPVNEIKSANYSSRLGVLLDVTVEVYNYVTLGYSSMPKFILGTDASGIDVLTRMFTGLRTSLILGVCTAAFCFLFGLIWGSVSGYFGGAVDLAMERFCDILGGVPWIVVMTLCILHLGNNFFTFFLALCMTGWMGTAARTRTQFYRFKGSEYVLASRTLGSSDIRLIFKHILPNSLGTIVTSSVLMIVSTIYSESTLAYLNLGLQGVSSFGVMLANNQQYIQSHSFLIVFPSIVMALMMISFNLFGNGLRDALNPALRGAED